MTPETSADAYLRGYQDGLARSHPVRPPEPPDERPATITCRACGQTLTRGVRRPAFDEPGYWHPASRWCPADGGTST